MATVFNRLRRKDTVTREEYERWVAQFVYPRVEQIPSVISQRIYALDGLVFRNDGLPYDVVEVIDITDLVAFRRDLQNNSAARAIQEQLAPRADFLDSVYGAFIPPGVSREPSRVTLGTGHTLQWRTAQFIIEAQSFEIPSIKGHIVGAGRSGGLGIFTNEYATLAIRFTVDMTNGTGLHTLYTVYGFEDGSSFTILGEGTTTAQNFGTDQESALFEGTLSFQQGSGRFAGVQGSGSYRGKRLASFLPQAPTYLDLTATVTFATC